MTAVLEHTPDTSGAPMTPDAAALTALQRWESDGGAYDGRRAD